MLKEGDSAPNFSLKGSDGKIHTLKEFSGKFLVLYFYPKDDTPGCTIEAKTFNKRNSDFRAIGAEVVGISKDSFESHCSFRDKYNLEFLLLSDPTNSTIKAYGAYGDREIFGMGTLRNTYLIGKDGTLLKIFENVSPDKNPQELISAIKSLNSK
jgi:peroxiredoxin Q/BCP